MSSVTPASFVDDGDSFRKRTPHGFQPAYVANWINNAGSDVTSAYTGSFVDDGADMIIPSKDTPGFGHVDSRFYKQRKRRDSDKRGAWNDDIEKAVAGDIQRSLEAMKGIGKLQIKRAHDEEKRKRHSRKDTVTVPLPLKWGTFVIKTDDGRVIVVDKNGEYDSGPIVSNHVPQEQTRWVKAPTTASIPSLPLSLHPLSERLYKRHDKEKEKRHRSRSDKMSQNNLPSTKTLVTIPESESEFEDAYQPSTGEGAMSPTGFFMTGGTEWPSQSAASVASPSRSKQDKNKPLSVKPTPHVRSPPGSWPSPPLSPTKYTSISESSTGIEASTHLSNNKESQRSRRSRKSHRSSRHDTDHVSVNTYSTYKAPTVEDADTSSENAWRLKEIGWAASHTGSAGGWGGSRNSRQDTWAGSSKRSDKNSKYSVKTMNKVVWADEDAASDGRYGARSVQNWVGDRVKTISEASSRVSKRDRQARSDEQQSDGAGVSEVSWDGYERPKTFSEVSVAGSGSEHNWPESPVTSRHSSKTGSQRSRHRHKKSRGGSQATDDNEQDWGGSQNATADGWTGDRTESAGENDWNGDKRGDMNRRYADGFDEGDQVYLKENRDTVSARIGNRRQSDAGWM